MRGGDMSPIFSYRAKDKNGGYQDGRIEALNQNDVVDKLEAQGLCVVSLKEGINAINEYKEKNGVGKGNIVLIGIGIIIVVVLILSFSSSLATKKPCKVDGEKYELVKEETIKQFIDTLNNCEFARFAPGDSASTMENIFNEAVSIVSIIESELK